jgi:hypothetical protein
MGANPSGRPTLGQQTAACWAYPDPHPLPVAPLNPKVLSNENQSKFKTKAGVSLKVLCLFTQRGAIASVRIELSDVSCHSLSAGFIASGMEGHD